MKSRLRPPKPTLMRPPSPLVRAGVLLFIVLAAVPVALAGQEQQENEPTQEWAPPPAPSIFQIPARAVAVADSAAQAEQAVRRLRTVGGLEAETEDAASRARALRALTESMVDQDVIRLERLSRLRDQALIETADWRPCGAG